jgi:hypothetical protein
LASFGTAQYPREMHGDAFFLKKTEVSAGTNAKAVICRVDFF